MGVHAPSSSLFVSPRLTRSTRHQTSSGLSVTMARRGDQGRHDTCAAYALAGAISAAADNGFDQTLDVDVLATVLKAVHPSIYDGAKLEDVADAWNSRQQSDLCIDNKEARFRFYISYEEFGSFAET